MSDSPRNPLLSGHRSQPQSRTMAGMAGSTTNATLERHVAYQTLTRLHSLPATVKRSNGTDNLPSSRRHALWKTKVNWHVQLWRLMELLILIVVLAALNHTLAFPKKSQPARKPYGGIPYRPFPPYKPCPPRPAAPIKTSSRTPVIPKLKSKPRILGVVSDPHYNRDSCGSTTFGDRTFWTCRDTELIRKDGSVQELPVITSTASWSDFDKDGNPAFLQVASYADVLERHSVALELYGNNNISDAYFPVLSQFCDPPAGHCEDNTRYALWPDLPPLVTPTNDYASVVGYTWIRQSHITPNLTTVTENPGTILYRVEYLSNTYRPSNSLPTVSVVDANFWLPGEISFGNYGNVIRNGTAYLFGQAQGMTALARVPADQVIDKFAYEYWVDGAWTSEMPTISQAGINITNTNVGGQGTYYYSDAWESYVWIGGSVFPVAEFWITTAPEPEGPWIEPFRFYTGPEGNYSLGAYSVQAHPGLARNAWEKHGRNEIYVTYTKNDLYADGISYYTTPLVKVEWQ